MYFYLTEIKKETGTERTNKKITKALIFIGIKLITNKNQVMIQIQHRVLSQVKNGLIQLVVLRFDCLMQLFDFVVRKICHFSL